MTRLASLQTVRRRFRFIGDTIAELRKVAWPSRSELVRLTALVLAVLIVTGVALGATDFAFSRLVNFVFLSGR